MSVEESIKDYICKVKLHDFVDYYSSRLDILFGDNHKFDIASYCDSNSDANETVKSLVNDIRQYMPFKTTKKYRSKISVSKLADTLYEAIGTEISGASCAYILTPTDKCVSLFFRDLPVLVLFGDFHEGRQGCLSGKNSFYNGTLLKTLDTSMKTNEIVTDFFLEVWEKEYDMSDDTQSSIYDTIHYLQWCFGKLKDDSKCPVSTIRTHFADPRQNKYDAECIFTLLHECTSYVEFEEQCRIKYKNFSAYNILGLILERMKLGAKEFCKRNHENPFLQTHSKCFIELSQLPSTFQTLIWDFYHEFKSHSFPDSSDIPLFEADAPLVKEEEYIAYIHEEQIFHFCKKRLQPYYVNTSKGNINLIFWVGCVATLDIYYLSRAFKSPIGNLPSQCSVLYAGNHHIQNLLFFLVNQTELYQIRYLAPEDKSKCLKCTTFTTFCHHQFQPFEGYFKIYKKTHTFFPQVMKEIELLGIQTALSRKSLHELLKKHDRVIFELLYYDHTQSPFRKEAYLFTPPILNSLIRVKSIYKDFMCKIATHETIKLFIDKDIVFPEGWHIGPLIKLCKQYEGADCIDFLYSNTRVTKCDMMEIMVPNFVADQTNKPYLTFVSDCIVILNFLSAAPGMLNLKNAIRSENVKMIQYVLTHTPFIADRDTIDLFKDYLTSHKEVHMKYLRHFKQEISSYFAK